MLNSPYDVQGNTLIWKDNLATNQKLLWTIFSKHLSNIVHPISIGVHVTRIPSIIGQIHDEQCILQEIKKGGVKESNYGMSFYHLLNDFCPNINHWVLEDNSPGQHCLDDNFSQVKKWQLWLSKLPVYPFQQ